MTKIYVASSWKNHLQPAVVRICRFLGFEVYDFKNPKPGDHGFSWKEIAPEFKNGDVIDSDTYKRLLNSPEAERGYQNDITALKECDICLFVLPCGRSASWEFGYACAGNKRCAVLWFGLHEPDLMFKETTILANAQELESWLLSQGTAPTVQINPKINLQKYMVMANEASGSVFVKEKDFFISQGGDKESWGKDWIEVSAESIEDARRIGCNLFPHARPYERQAK